MTTTRTHYCNLCHIAVDDTRGFGCYHVTAGIEPRPMRDAENHLCWKCAEQVAAIFRARAAQAG